MVAWMLKGKARTVLLKIKAIYTRRDRLLPPWGLRAGWGALGLAWPSKVSGGLWTM